MHSLNEYEPLYETVFGIEIAFNDMHPLKTDEPILVTDEGMMIFVSF